MKHRKFNIIGSIRASVALVLLLLAVPLVATFLPGNVNAATAGKDELVIAYRYDSQPIQFTDANGEAAGILIDLWRLWGKLSGSRIRFVAGDNKQAQAMLQDGRADIIAGLFENDKRSQFLDFSVPILSSPYHLFFRNSLHDIKRVGDAGQRPVGVTAGSYHENYLRENYPALKLALYAGYKDLFAAVEAGEIDLFVTQPLYLERYVSGWHTDFSMLDKPLYVRPYKASVAKNNRPLLQKINQYLTSISLSQRNVITSRWLGQQVPGKQNASKRLDLTDAEKQWLAEHPHLRVGGEQNWPPFDKRGKDGRWRGITPDYLNLIVQRLGIDYEVQTTPDWSRKLAMLRAGKLDLMGSMAYTDERAEYLDFAGPYFSSPYVLVTHSLQQHIKSVTGLRDKIVAAEDGYFVSEQLEKNHPEIRLLKVSDTQSALDAVAERRADVYIGNRAVVTHLLDQQLRTDLKVAANAPFPTTRLYFGVRKDQPILSGLIQKALDSITGDELRAIRKKWVPVGFDSGFTEKSALGKSTGQTSGFELSEEEQQWLAARKPFQTGVMENWPPFDFINSKGELGGIGLDYIKALNQRLGNVLAPVPGDWKRNYGDVTARRLDLIMEITPKPEREQYFNFTRPYMKVPHVIIARKQQPYLASEESLKGLTVALEEGFGNVAYFQQSYPQVQLQLYRNTAEALDAVSRGEADAYVGNRAVAMYLIEQRLLSNLKQHGALSKPASELAIGVRKDWPVLRDILQRALDDISAQEHHAILARWISVPVAGQQTGQAVPEDKADDLPIQLTEQERRWLDGHRSLRLGVDAAWAPLEYIDEKGDYQGLSSSYMKLFTDQLGIHMTPPKRMPWEQVLDELKNKHLDIAPLLAPTGPREEYLLFTRSYLDFPLVIFNRQGQTLLTGLGDLQDSKVAVVAGYAIADYLERDQPDLILVKFNNASEALQAVSLGKVDAFIGPLAVGGYLITREGYSNLQVGASTPYTYHLSIGVRNDWPELVSIFNKLINNLTEQTKNEITRNWLSVTYQKQVDYRLLWRLLGIVALILLVGAIWITQIKRRSQALYESRQRLSMALDGARLGAWQVDIDVNGVMSINMNETFAIHHGLPEGTLQMLYDEFLYYVDESGRQRIQRQTRRFLQNLTHRLAIEYQPADKSRWLFSQGRVFRNPQKHGQVRVIGITQDITERKQAQQMLEQASRFKSEFLANMSHEVRTPMNAIVGLGHLLSRTSLSSKQKDYVDKMQLSAQSLLAIIDDVLDFSKIEAGQLKIEKIEFNLDEIFANLAALTAVRLGSKPVEYVYQIDPQVPAQLISDPYRLSQILTNLVSNAVKFTESGSILVRVSVKQKQPLLILFEVIDSGIGIAADRLEDLFEAFVQADGSTTRRYGGTGLGLSISKQLTQLLGGNIGVESTPGKGSRFYFELPMQHAKTRKQLIVLDLRNMHVLLVDDNPMARQVLFDMLQSLLFRVTAVVSGEEALQQLENSSELPDLVLLDWYMPDMDGEQTARKIRASARSGLTIIAMITAYGREAVERHIDSALLDGVLVKPITSSQLFDAIIQTSSEFAGEATTQHKQSAVPAWEAKLSGEVLLVEDKYINQQVAREILQQMGLQVRVCGNGRQALDFVRRHKPDLVLMDIQMPEMDGYEATREIRRLYDADSLPIFAMTAHAMVGDAEKSLRAGMNGHVTKPVNPQLLYQALVKWLPDRPSAQPAKSPPAASDTNSWPDQLPGINLLDGLKRIGGNQELYKRLLQEFIENHGQAATQIEQALQLGDNEAAKREVHSLRGIAANIGAEPLAQAAAKIDLALQEQRSISAESLNSFRDACQQLIGSLTVLLVEGGAEAGESV